jgi:Protein of unknown function (DUF3631)
MGECNHGKPLTQNRLAKMLGAFGLKTKTFKIHGEVGRGYELDALRASFSRYCPDSPIQRATPLSMNEINVLGENQSATIGVEVALQNKPNRLKNNGCSTVALQNPESGDESEIGGFDGPWRAEFCTHARFSRLRRAALPTDGGAEASLGLLTKLPSRRRCQCDNGHSDNCIVEIPLPFFWAITNHGQSD